jgi:drug/metabolite transporter (DMT)-like permease
MTESRFLRAELSLVLVTIIAAIGWVLSKYALEEFAPFTFISLRFLLAGLVLLAIAWPQLANVSSRQITRSVATGAVMGCSMLLWVLALQRTAYVGVGAFIISLNAVAVPLIGRLLFRQVISPRLLLALLPALLGLAMISLDDGFGLAPAQALFVVAMLGFAVHLNLSSTFVRDVPALLLSALQLLTTGVIAGVAALLLEQWRAGISAAAWWLLVCSALFATSLRFAIQFKVLQNISASHASMIFLFEPVWTAALSALLLAERMSSWQLIGCALILFALLIYRLQALKSLWLYFRH